MITFSAAKIIVHNQPLFSFLKNPFFAQCPWISARLAKPSWLLPLNFLFLLCRTASPYLTVIHTTTTYYPANLSTTAGLRGKWCCWSASKQVLFGVYTLFEIFLFCPKNSNLISREKLSWVKTRKIDAVLDFLAVDNFDFTRKIVKKILGEKLVKMLGICTF